MKKTQKKNISEATAEAMGLGGYSQSGGQSNYDASGRGDMIPQPVDFGGAAMAQAQVPIGAGMAAPVQMQSSSEEEPEEEDMEEDMEDDDTEETNEEAKADFRNALVSLLGEDVSPSLVNQLVENGQARQLHFSWQKAAQEIHDLMQGC